MLIKTTPRKFIPPRRQGAKKNILFIRTWRALRLCASHLLPAFAIQQATEISNILGSKLFSIDSNEAPSLLGIYAETFRRPHNGGNNILITGTTAKIPAQVLAYLLFGGTMFLVEQLIDGQLETGCTKATFKTHRLQ